MPREISLFEEGETPRPPEQFNAARYCLAPAAEDPDAIALIVLDDAEAEGEVWRRGALEAAVACAAAGFRAAGLRPGDRVMLRLGNRPTFPILFFGAIAAGGVPTPTSAQLSAAEAAFIAEDSGAALLCVEDALAFDGAPAGATVLGDAAMREMLSASTPEGGLTAVAEDTRADDAAYLVYTSGATGRPKGVLHAHRAIYARRMMWRDWYALRAGDRMLHAGAFNWTYTLGAGLMDPWAAGAATIIYNGPRDPGVWAKIARRMRPSLFAAVPGVYRQLLKYGEGVGAAFKGLRHGLSAGEALPEALRDAWRAETGLEIYEALGMSECSTFISSSPTSPPAAGFAGRPQNGRRVAVLPEASDDATPAPIGVSGILSVRRDDPGLMLGYWRRPDDDAASMRGDWFLTGDRARMSADGRIAYEGRADDVMNAGGYRVAPQEVETALAAHPMVLECAVVEIRPRPDVSVIAAFIVLADDAPNADAAAAALRAHCADRLAAYKSPREYRFVDTLPRTATGKLRRRALTETCSAPAASSN